MTTYELYNQAIRPLPADERLNIARLILDGLAPDSLSDRPSDVRDPAHLEQLLLDGLNSGPTIEADAAFWARKEQRVIERLGPA